MNLRSEFPENFYERVAAVTEDLDIGMESLWARVPQNGDPAFYLVNCNDFFAYACADCEVLGPEDWELFVQTAKELDDLEYKLGQDCYATYYLMELYCCRKRNMQPLSVHMYGRTDGTKHGKLIDDPAVVALMEKLPKRA